MYIRYNKILMREFKENQNRGIYHAYILINSYYKNFDSLQNGLVG